jgi:hypothetical protein
MNNFISLLASYSWASVSVALNDIVYYFLQLCFICFVFACFFCLGDHLIFYTLCPLLMYDSILCKILSCLTFLAILMFLAMLFIIRFLYFVFSFFVYVFICVILSLLIVLPKFLTRYHVRLGINLKTLLT